MKNLCLMACLSLGLFLTAHAQKTTTASNASANATMDDYERMLQAHNKMAFRSYVINTLGLTSEQVKDFDPLYTEYMKDKNKLAQKKTKLFNDYVDEIAENDSPANEENDKEEFMEDYLELQVDESKLRKEYFDRMEDKITADNAFGFFLLEDMVASDYYQQILRRRFVPYVVITEEVTPTAPSTTAPNSNSTTKNKAGVDRKYRGDIDAYSAWVSNSNNQAVKDPHHYTRSGLNSLVGAISALGMACNMNADQTFETKKRKIMQNNEQLGKNPSSNEHPDLMKESFTMAADMLKTVQQQCNQNVSQTAVMQVWEAARKIDVNKTSMAQADVIKDFFKKAQTAIDGMANDIPWSTK